MDSVFAFQTANYYSLTLNSLLYLMPQYQNGFYCMVSPSSSGEDSRETSIQTFQRKIVLQEMRKQNRKSLKQSSSESEHRKTEETQKNQYSSHKNFIDEQFQVNTPTKKRGTLYKKKNTESNIINQAISFLNTERSLPFLSKLLQSDEEKIEKFYRIMATIKKVNKKYTNRKYLKRLIDFAERSEFHRAYLKQKNVQMSLQQVRLIIRKLVFYFIRNYSYLTLMSSSKIYKETLPEHFWRKRQIQKILFNCIKVDQLKSI